MELYDTSPEVRGIVQTIVYDYFSCFKDYDAASKSNKVEDLTDGLIQYFNELNDNSPLMDFQETVRHICFVHRTHSLQISSLINKLESKEFKQKLQVELSNIFEFNHTLSSVKDSKKDIFDSRYIYDLKKFLKKNNGMELSLSEEKTFEDKLMMIISDFETLPILPHLGIILTLMMLNLNQVWLESEQFDLKALTSKLQKHILQSKSILGAKMKGTFKKSVEKVALGDQCLSSIIPVLNPQKKIFGLLSHYKMLTNTVQKFNKYYKVVQNS